MNLTTTITWKEWAVEKPLETDEPFFIAYNDFAIDSCLGMFANINEEKFDYVWMDVEVDEPIKQDNILYWIYEKDLKPKQ